MLSNGCQKSIGCGEKERERAYAIIHVERDAMDG